MWCCYFKDGELIVSSLRRTQKGSQSAAAQKLNFRNWKNAKDNGIRCYEVAITKLALN